MALFKGSSGKISVTEGTGTESFLAHTTSWSIDSSMDIDETAYFGGSLTEEGTKEKTPGTIAWTASIDGAVDGDESSHQDTLLDAHNNQVLVKGRFYLDAATAYEGEGYIDSISFSHAADSKGEFTATISGNGKIARITI